MSPCSTNSDVASPETQQAEDDPVRFRSRWKVVLGVLLVVLVGAVAYLLGKGGF
ncbi:MAG: hypothetical protein ACQESR_21710 [Planctomycetota bacterium]